MPGTDQLTLPRYIFVGPQRTGSTWIYEFLRMSAEVGITRGVKETFFFDKHFDKGFHWYANHFQVGKNVYADVGPSYFFSEQARRRLSNYHHLERCIIVLRNPFDRILSESLHLRRMGIEQRSIRTLIADKQYILSRLNYPVLAKWRLELGGHRLIELIFDELVESPVQFAHKIGLALKLDLAAVSQLELPGKVNAGVVGSNELLAAKVSKWADWLRTRRMYFPINLAKQVGIKKLVYGSAPSSGTTFEKVDWPKPTLKMLFKDIECLETLMNCDLSSWRPY